MQRHCFVTLDVVDIRGRKVETLVNEYKKKGSHKLMWITPELPSGLYLIRLKAGEFMEIRKVVLQR